MKFITSIFPSFAIIYSEQQETRISVHYKFKKKAGNKYGLRQFI